MSHCFPELEYIVCFDSLAHTCHGSLTSRLWNEDNCIAQTWSSDDCSAVPRLAYGWDREKKGCIIKSTDPECQQCWWCQLKLWKHGIKGWPKIKWGVSKWWTLSYLENAMSTRVLIVCNHKLLSSSFNFLLLLLYPLFSCFLIIEIIIWNNLYSSVQKSCVATRFFIFS